MAARRKHQLERLEDVWDGRLDRPFFFVHIGAQVFLGFADDDGTGVAGRWIDGADALSELQNGSFVCAMIDEVRLHGLELAAVGRDGPGAEVVELLVDVVADGAVGIAAALRLEDTDGLSLSFDGVILLVDGDEVLVEEDDRGGIYGAGGGWRLGGVDGPLRRRLGLGRRWNGAGEGSCEIEKHEGRKYGKTRCHQLPFAAWDEVRTSCC